MPPLPHAVFDEHTRQLIASTRRYQIDLEETQIPRLRECKGPLAVQQRLAAELREDTETFARQVEALGDLIGDQRSELNRRELAGVVGHLRIALASIRKDSRLALLTSKRAIDSRVQSDREQLLSSSVFREKSGSTEGKTIDDSLMKTNNEVTAALRRTMNLMQGELERSVLTVQMLDTSTATLRSASATHDTLSNVMATSKQLVTALEKSDWLDRLLISSALVFFFLVVLFILKQRMLDRGLRIALWWTRFIPDLSGDPEFVDMDHKGAGDVLSVASATIATAIASTTSIATAAISSAMMQASSNPSELSEPSSTLTVSLEPHLSQSSMVFEGVPIETITHDDL